MPRRTLARPAELSGTGLFTGLATSLRMVPARPGMGVVFVREDLGGGHPIPARAEFHVPAERRTALQAQGHRVDTVEHLLAAATALELDDVSVVMNGPEIPIMDGSFTPFMQLIESAGLVAAEGTLDWALLGEPVTVTEGESVYFVEPAARLAISVTLEYAEPVIGIQSAVWQGDMESFRREIAPARTFGFEREVELLRSRGALQGATHSSGLLLSADRVLNGTARWPDEFARHKAGDLLGDLALLGARARVRIRAQRPSHRGNIACVRAILSAARIVEE